MRDLMRMLIARRAGTNAPLLYLAGEDRAADLPAELSARGIAAEMRVVYRVVTAPFPPALIEALQAGAVDAVMHFSRRSADNYLAGASKAGISRTGDGRPPSLPFGASCGAPCRCGPDRRCRTAR